MGALCIEWFPGDDPWCVHSGALGIALCERVYSSGLTEKQGSLFLTGCVLLSPIV